MTVETATRAAELAQDMGYEVEVRPAYSGRGMYGRTTAALTSNELNAIQLGVFIGIAAVEEDGSPWIDDEVVRNLRSDQMGLGVVVY